MGSEMCIRDRSRKRLQAQARLRPLAILDASIKGEKGQPPPARLKRLGKELAAGKTWQELFPGVASVDITTEGTGPSLSLRFTKKEGIPIQVVPAGTPGVAVVAIKRVDELGYYCLSLSRVAEQVGLTVPKTLAIVRYLGVDTDSEYFKLIKIGKVGFKRYSQKAAARIREELPKVSIDEIWRTHGPRPRQAARK